MQPMQKVILSDASCLILLDKIGELDLLQVAFGEIIITPEVEREYGRPLPEWMKVLEVKNKTYQDLLGINIDIGEASIIALAVELEDCLLIIDDLKGRRFAKKLAINYTGTLGVLLAAKENEIISSIKPIIEKIQHTNFRVSDELISKVLKQAGEAR